MLRLEDGQVFYQPYSGEEMALGAVEELKCIEDTIIFEHDGATICIPYDAENLKAEQEREVFHAWHQAKEEGRIPEPPPVEPGPHIPTAEERIVQLEVEKSELQSRVDLVQDVLDEILMNIL